MLAMCVLFLVYLLFLKHQQFRFQDIYFDSGEIFNLNSQKYTFWTYIFS